LVETGIDRPARVIDVMDIRPLGSLGEIAKLGLGLGLGLAEAKQILARLQQAIVAVQVTITRFCVRTALRAVKPVTSRTGGFIG
jgi:hypothetical protein